MTPIVLTVPDPGCGFMNLNHRMHWRPKADMTKQWREATAWQARVKRIPTFGRVHIEVVFRKNDARKSDCHNLLPTAKAAIDGLVDAHVIPDDNDGHLVGPDLRPGEPIPRPGKACLVITITPLDVEAAA